MITTLTACNGPQHSRSSDENGKDRPLSGMRFSFLILSVVFTSCIVPVYIPRPSPEDGGSEVPDAGAPPQDAGQDAGFDAGTSRPCSVPAFLGMFLARTTRTFVFPGCATASFTSDPEVNVVTAPNADGSATVSITPSTVGAWELTLNANGSTQTRELLTDEVFDADAGYVVRYPDRIDTYYRYRTVTPSGRLLVASGTQEFTVYGVDGGFEQTIAANHSPFVWTNDALLTVAPQAPLVERWVETPGGMVSTGTLDAAGTSYCVFCRVDGDRLFSMYGYDLVESTWDGGAGVSRQVVTSKFQLPENFYLLVPEAPEKVWADDLCSYEPGCSSTVCSAIQTCLGRRGDSKVIYANDTHAIIWIGGAGRLELWALPLGNRSRLHLREGNGLEPNTSIGEPIQVREGEAVIHRNRIVFRYLGPEAIITRHWLVVPVSARELRFIRR